MTLLILFFSTCPVIGEIPPRALYLAMVIDGVLLVSLIVAHALKP